MLFHSEIYSSIVMIGNAGANDSDTHVTFRIKSVSPYPYQQHINMLADKRNQLHVVEFQRIPV